MQPLRVCVRQGDAARPLTPCTPGPCVGGVFVWGRVSADPAFPCPHVSPAVQTGNPARQLQHRR